LSRFTLVRYLGSPAPYWYVAHNSLLLTYNQSLPGLFAANPEVNIVNGSLWTLPIETVGYVAICLAGVFGLLRRNLAALAALALLALVLVRPGMHAPTGNSPVPDRNAFIAWYLSLFALGACLRLSGKLPAFSPAALLLLIGIWVASWNTGAIYLASAPLIAYASLYAGRATASRFTRLLTRPGDVSYGMYIYAFPIQQAAIVLLGGHTTPWLLLACTAPVVYLCAVLSWRLIEAPALRRKPQAPQPLEEALIPAAIRRRSIVSS
jgi:peptidoglycan/LPS O-acetylase OafA/YrhL